jgi:hypothetical protein
MMYTRIDIILTVRKLFDMYKSFYAEKAIYFCFKLNAHVFGHLKAKKAQFKHIF